MFLSISHFWIQFRLKNLPLDQFFFVNLDFWMFLKLQKLSFLFHLGPGFSIRRVYGMEEGGWSRGEVQTNPPPSARGSRPTLWGTRKPPKVDFFFRCFQPVSFGILAFSEMSAKMAFLAVFWGQKIFSAWRFASVLRSTSGKVHKYYTQILIHKCYYLSSFSFFFVFIRSLIQFIF